MKKLFLLATLVYGVFAAGVFAAEKNPLLAASQIVWAGLDYSQTRLIGAPNAFKDPGTTFVEQFESWNSLFLKERIRLVQKETGKDVVVDIDAVTTANKHPDSTQSISSPGADDTISSSHLTAAKIAEIVKAYDLKEKNGLAVVFIVDRFVKVGKKGEGAVYVVAFDLATREVAFSERVVGKANGNTFRNYWFHVIKYAEKALKELH
jgi:hypothetical protein